MLDISDLCLVRMKLRGQRLLDAGGEKHYD